MKNKGQISILSKEKEKYGYSFCRVDLEDGKLMVQIGSGFSFLKYDLCGKLYDLSVENLSFILSSYFFPSNYPKEMVDLVAEKVSSSGYVVMDMASGCSIVKEDEESWYEPRNGKSRIESVVMEYVENNPENKERAVFFNPSILSYAFGVLSDLGLVTADAANYVPKSWSSTWAKWKDLSDSWQLFIMGIKIK